MSLTKSEQEALLTISLMAAFADGGKSEVERAEVKRIAEGLSELALNPSALYQRVLLRQMTAREAAAPLKGKELRQLAYEMAVCVCEADELLNDAEKIFLAELRGVLQLEDQNVDVFQQHADAVAQAPLQVSERAVTALPPVLAGSGGPVDHEIDRMVLNAAMVNGALELLPDSLATMAIVPLQMNLVYRIGKRYGYELDRRHITELLGAAGLGLTSQVVEGFARKLLAGLLGRVAGGLGRGVGRQVASSAMTFASTYALGQMAQRYYAGGRQFSAAQLKELFASLSGQARSLHDRYAQEIQQRASQLNVSQLVDLVRGQRAFSSGA
jgi:uncharacterized protein (DUF697 family)/tellurite resistance protein